MFSNFAKVLIRFVINFCFASYDIVINFELRNIYTRFSFKFFILLVLTFCPVYVLCHIE